MGAGGGESSTPASDDGELEDEHSEDAAGDEDEGDQVEGGMRDARRIISGAKEGKVIPIEEGTG